jgi:DNA-binding Xre family transcriptional regulator
LWKILFPVEGVKVSREDQKQVEFRRNRAEKISRALMNKAWTRTKLAHETGYDVRTIRTVLGGIEPVRDQTIIDVCEALGIEPELSPERVEEIEVAEPWYGSYAREPYRNYEGAYFACRRSFSFPGQFIRSVFEIRWDDEDWIFVFDERQSYVATNKRKVDHSQRGEIYISQFTDLIHFVTVNAGAVRTITLTKMRGAGQVMRGSVLTQSDRGLFFQPSMSAIYLEKIPNYEPAIHLAQVGPILAESEDYEVIKEEIERIERDVMFVASPETVDRRKG